MSHGHHRRGSSRSSHRSVCETPGGRTTGVLAACGSPAKLCGDRVPVTDTFLMPGVVLQRVTRHSTRAELPSKSMNGVTFRSSTYRSRLASSCTSFQMPPGSRVGSLQSQLMPCSAPFISTRFRFGRIHLDDEQVLARPDPARSVEREAVEEALVGAEVVAVQPRVGEVVDALEQCSRMTLLAPSGA